MAYEFAILAIAYCHYLDNVRVRTTTNSAVHLTCHYTSVPPRIHKLPRFIRGIRMDGLGYWCFVASTAIEQDEAGDTKTHTFTIPDWYLPDIKYLVFTGTVLSLDSPSISPYFKHQHPGADPAIEESQLAGITWSSILQGAGWGQKLPIPTRTLTALSFKLKRVGTPTGYVYYQIKRTSDNQQLWEETLTDSINISTTPAFYTIPIDPPITLTGEHRIIALATGGTAGNLINIFATLTDVKPNEHLFFKHASGAYTPHPTHDMTYIYTYQPCPF